MKIKICFFAALIFSFMPASFAGGESCKSGSAPCGQGASCAAEIINSIAGNADAKALAADGFNLAFAGTASCDLLDKINKFYRPENAFKGSESCVMVKFFKGREAQILLLDPSDLRKTIFKYPLYKIVFLPVGTSGDSAMPDYRHDCAKEPSFYFCEFAKALNAADAYLKGSFLKSDPVARLENNKKELAQKLDFFMAKQAEMKTPREISANENMIKAIEAELSYAEKNSDEIIAKQRDFYSAKSVSRICALGDSRIYLCVGGGASLKNPKERGGGLDPLKINLVYLIETGKIVQYKIYRGYNICK